MASSTPTHFSLASRSLKLDTASDLHPHTHALTTSTSFTTLDLSGNTLGAPACAALAPLLSSQTHLESANLADIFTSRLLSEIPPALSSLLTALLSLPNLHTVDLSDNAFGLNTVAPLVEYLSQHTPLQHLVLQNNGLGPAAGAMVADALTALAKRKDEARKAGRDVPRLETVICGRNRLESGSMGAWVGMLRAHGGIRVVKMVQNGIRQDGVVRLLGEGLGGCEGLEVLDLQDNTFTISGARALAGVVGGWKGLRELGVGDSLLGTRGAVVLAEALRKGGCRGLEVLRAQYNEIDGKGVKALLGAARELDELRRVEINGNKFSEDDEAVEELRTLLEERKEKSGGEEADGEWGLDELSDLEEESDEEDEDEAEDEADVDDEKEEEKEKADRREEILKDADEEESMKVSEKKDEDVDALADVLGKTHVG